MNETPPLHFIALGDRPDLIPLVAGWWCAAFGLPQRHASLDNYIAELACPVPPDTFPVHLLVLNDSDAVGVATLKDWNMLQDRFPDYQHWLSGVYVLPAARGKGIATALCRKLLEIAAAQGITRVHLQTEALDGGLYARISFTPVEQLSLDGVEVLVMTWEAAPPR